MFNNEFDPIGSYIIRANTFARANANRLINQSVKENKIKVVRFVELEGATVPIKDILHESKTKIGFIT